jgi:glycosyltransferase involved in cell wall biosynthesis
MSLLFYDDSPVFGGHEVMSLAGLDAVLESSPEALVFLASESNEKLLARLADLKTRHPHLLVETVDWHSSKLEAARNLFRPSRIARLADRFEKLGPSLVVAIQGNIEHSSLSLHAARRARIPSASYIPVPHSNHQMGAKLGWLRDRFCGPLFRLPDAFITITDEMARLLRVRGATAPIHIVYNGVDTARFQPGDQAAARSSLVLPDGKTLLGVVGRIEFRQKQQHLLVDAIASKPDLAARCHLVFAGDGPDAGALRALLDQRKVSGTVLSWCDPAPLYQALDALVIPSRYEGLPLVMLEALATGTTVFGSDRDGMRDLLPPDRRFDPRESAPLAAAISGWIGHGCPGPEDALIRRVRESMSMPSFRHAFTQVIHTLGQAESGLPKPGCSP